jgi:ABC-type dipeptide/oligopeptide/nickel transport system ATPase component
MADSILVLQDGRVMEYGRVKEVLDNPQNNYTRKLLSAVPRLRRG